MFGQTHGHGALEVNVREEMLALGWTAHAWERAGHKLNPYADYGRGVWTKNVYVSTEPPIVVAASAPKPPPVVERPGPFAQSRAAGLLHLWLGPVASGRAPASSPLLIIGQSLWSPVQSAIAAAAGTTYPRSYPRITLDELPNNSLQASLLRANALECRVICVSLPSVEVAAALADGTRWLRSQLPHHSWAFFAPAPAGVLPSNLPAAVADTFTILSWADTRPDLQQAPEAMTVPANDPLVVVEASHTRVGGLLLPGMRPSTRLGLEHASYQEAAASANAQQAQARREHFAALGGSFEGYSSKRIKLSDFSRGAGIVTLKDHAHFGDYTRA